MEVNSSPPSSDKSCFEFGQSKKRCIALLYLFLIGFGLHFTYDIPSSLQPSIIEQFHLTNNQFSLLNWIYIWPNIVFNIISGLLIDRIFGVKLSSVVYISIAVLGVSLFALACIFKVYSLMLAARFIFGLGGESLSICLLTYTVIWFTGKELNTVFAIVYNISRISSMLIYQSSTPLLNYLSHTSLNKISLEVTVVAMSCPILLSFCSTILLAGTKINKHNSKNQLNKKEIIEELIKIKEIYCFRLEFWLLCSVSSAYFMTVSSFLTNNQTSLQYKHNITQEDANYLVNFFIVISIILSLIFGLYIDNRGRNLSFITSSILIGIVAHSLNTFTGLSAYIIICLLSLSFGLMVSSIWASFSISSRKNQLSTAYGLVTSIMNAWLSAGNFITGYIVERFDFFALEIFYITCLNVCILLTSVIWILDRKNDSILNMTAEQRRYNHYRSQGLSQITLDRISSVSNSLCNSIGNLSTVTLPSMNSADIRLW